MLKKQVIVAMLMASYLSSAAWAEESPPAPPTPPPPEVIAANLLKGPNLGGSTLEVEFEYTVYDFAKSMVPVTNFQFSLIYRYDWSSRLTFFSQGEHGITTWIQGNRTASHFGDMQTMAESVLPISMTYGDGTWKYQLDAQVKQLKVWANVLRVTDKPLDHLLDPASIIMNDQSMSFSVTQPEFIDGPILRTVHASLNSATGLWVIDRFIDSYCTSIHSNHIVLEGGMGIIPGQIVFASTMFPTKLTVWKVTNVRMVPEQEAATLLAIPDSTQTDPKTGKSIGGVIRYDAEGVETISSL